MNPGPPHELKRTRQTLSGAREKTSSCRAQAAPL